EETRTSSPCPVQPVLWTVPWYRHIVSTAYTKTQYNNQCKVGFVSGGLCTVLTTCGEPNVTISPVADRAGGSAGIARRAVGMDRARESPANLEREHTGKNTRPSYLRHGIVCGVPRVICSLLYIVRKI